SATSAALRGSLDRVKAMQLAISRTPNAPGPLDKQLHELRQNLLDLDEALNGNRSKQAIGEKDSPTVQNRLSTAVSGTRLSTYGPSPMHRRSLEIAKTELGTIKAQLKQAQEQEIPQLEKAMAEAGAPWIEGQPLPR
ncbi:MAG: glycosyl hydrolase, partial [Anaerolineae bacterium]|nr:glycosyl hydrolase [Anaerolineae bacterium]